MTLERKDIRAKLDHDIHAALAILAEVDGIDINDFVERELVAVICQRVHAATLIADRCERLVKTGTLWSSAGRAGSRRETGGAG